MWLDCFSKNRDAAQQPSADVPIQDSAVADRGRDCMNALAPVVRGCIERFGPASTIAALVSLLVAEAVEARQPAPVAQVLLHNARYLEAWALRAVTAPRDQARKEAGNGETARQ